MGLQLRTGKNGKNVTSDSDGRLYAGIAGTDRYVLDDGNKLAASLSDSNTLVVQSGAMLINGRHVTLDGTQTWNIPNGAQGKKRSNLCAVRYTKDSNGTEIAEAVTLSGDLTDGDPVDPAYNNTSILQNGTTISDYPLYRVITDGISANDPVPLFNVLTPLATLGASVDWGSSSEWTWKKYSNGWCELWCTHTYNLTKTGNYWFGSINLPFELYKTANSNKDFKCFVSGGGYGVNALYPLDYISNTTVNSVDVASVGVASDGTGSKNVHFYVIGKWK